MFPPLPSFTTTSHCESPAFCFACVRLAVMQRIIPPWCGFEHVPTSPQISVTGGSLWAAERLQPSRQYSWPLSVGLLIYCTWTTTITTVCHQLDLDTCLSPYHLHFFLFFLVCCSLTLSNSRCVTSRVSTHVPFLSLYSLLSLFVTIQVLWD